MVVGPFGARPAYAETPTTLEVLLDRPIWKVGERLVVTGRLTANGQPIARGDVRIGIDGNLEESDLRATTTADGTFRSEIPVEEVWGFGGHTVTFEFHGDDQNSGSSTSAVFQVSPAQVTPMVLVAHPHPDPVSPGQRVHLAGTLHNDRNEPAAGQSVVVVIDAATDSRAFGRVDDDGTWAIDFTVPTTPGQWSERFPAYPVHVVFDGDWWLSPAQQELALTLTEVPGVPVVEPSPTPSPTPSPSPTPTATTEPTMPISAGADPGPSWLPGWVVSPAFFFTTGGLLAVLLGATFISHGRRT